MKSDDPLKWFVATGSEKVLKVLALTVAAGVSIANGIQYALTGTLSSPAVIPFLLVVSVMFWLLHRRKLMAAFSTFLWGMFLGGLHASFLIAGFQSPGLLLLPLATLLSGWLLGARQTILMLAIAFTGFAAMAWLQTQGMLPAQSRTPAFWAVTYAAICLVGAVVGVAMTRNVRSQYQRALNLSDELAALNRDLEIRVTERTAELETALTRLRQTQDDLIQAEKLASLGSLVAGIAHELNTPIGNTVTGSSSLSERARAVQEMAASGAIKKSELFSSLGAIRDMADLVERSANRAAALVASFKQVAVDQVSERRRSFDLRRVVEENLDTLRPNLRQQPWQLVNEVPEGITCDSFPGPLGQVLINLVQNAIVHGFDGRDHGRVVINARIDGDRLSLSVSDDGVGMTTATTLRIFEPFFTTKLGQGGSGLGMAICYRIVATVLAGEIRVNSSPGTGSQFLVTMPLRTPGML